MNASGVRARTPFLSRVSPLRLLGLRLVLASIGGGALAFNAATFAMNLPLNLADRLLTAAMLLVLTPLPPLFWALRACANAFVWCYRDGWNGFSSGNFAGELGLAAGRRYSLSDVACNKVTGSMEKGSGKIGGGCVNGQERSGR